MIGALEDAQIAHLGAAERTTRHHTLDSLDEHTLWKAPFKNLCRRRFLDPAGMASVAVIDLVGCLLAGKAHLFGVDDDDVVTTIDVRRIARLVLAAKTIGNDRGKATDNEPFGIDDKPFLLDLGGFDRGS